MANDTKTIKATCLCGAAAHSITLPSSAFPLESYTCNCTSCRHVTGTLCLAVAFPPPSYSPSQDLLNKLDKYDFSRRFVYHFCKICGTQMLTRNIYHPDTPEPAVSWDIMSGTLEQWDGVVDLKGHYFIRDTLDGGFADLLPKLNGIILERLPGHDKGGQQLPSQWRAPEVADIKPSSKDTLHAHCKCKGVEFWVSRPSQQPNQAANGKGDGLGTKPWWLSANGMGYAANNCVCDSCRLASGMDVVQWAFIPKYNITLDSDSESHLTFQEGKLAFGTLKSYKSSEDVNRYFCGSCGAIVFYEVQDRPEILDIAVGLLDAPEGARAGTWLEWQTDRVSFKEDGVKRAEHLVTALEEGIKEFGKKESNSQVN